MIPYTKPIKTILFLISILVFASCENDESDNTNTYINDIEDIIISGSWKITTFNDEGENITSAYQILSFSFKTDNELLITENNDQIKGSWFIDPDDTPENIDFVLSIPASSEFDELNEDWDIVSINSSRIELEDLTDQMNPKSELVFEKQ